MTGKLYTLTATEAVKLIHRNEITVEQYAYALLERVEERNNIIKAWKYLDRDTVIEQARQLDQVPFANRGPLHGAAIGIKDIMDTKDMPTEYGSAFYKGDRPNSDASVVSLLRKAGVLIFGKTTTTELTVANTGPGTTNPHDPYRTPGGSSTGSAAAVADFQIPLSVGTQTGGSIIRPASYTGIFAIKTSWDSISLEGIKPVAPAVDSFGIFARCIEDLQLVVDALIFEDDLSSTMSSLHDFRIALVRSPLWAAAGPGTVMAMDKAAEILADNGIEVVEVSFPPEYADADALTLMHQKVFLAGSQVSFTKEYRLDKSKLSQEIRDLVENEPGFTRSEMIQASDRYASMRPIFDEMAANFTAILTPSAVDEAPLGLDDMGSPDFNFIWTGLHMPVVQIPAFVSTHDMPIGISLVAGRALDRQLLIVSKALSKPLMAEGGWKIKMPNEG